MISLLILRLGLDLQQKLLALAAKYLDTNIPLNEQSPNQWQLLVQKVCDSVDEYYLTYMDYVFRHPPPGHSLPLGSKTHGLCLYTSNATWRRERTKSTVGLGRDMRLRLNLVVQDPGSATSALKHVHRPPPIRLNIHPSSVCHFHPPLTRKLHRLPPSRRLTRPQRPRHLIPANWSGSSYANWAKISKRFCLFLLKEALKTTLRCLRSGN